MAHMSEMVSCSGIRKVSPFEPHPPCTDTAPQHRLSASNLRQYALVPVSV